MHCYTHVDPSHLLMLGGIHPSVSVYKSWYVSPTHTCIVTTTQALPFHTFSVMCYVSIHMSLTFGLAGGVESTWTFCRPGGPCGPGAVSFNTGLLSTNLST